MYYILSQIFFKKIGWLLVTVAARALFIVVAIWHNMPREQDGDDMIWRSADEEVLLAPLSDSSNYSIY